MGHVRESKLVAAIVAIIVIIVIAVLVFREHFKTHEERGSNFHLLYWWVGIGVAVLIAVVVTTAYFLEGWTSSKSSEYGIREHYEKVVDNMKARSKEKQRIRIAQQHGLQH